MNIIECTERELVSKVEKEHKEIICFGTAAMAIEMLENPYIFSKIAFFVDNDTSKHNQFFNVKDKSFPVKPVESLLNITWDKFIIVIATSHFKAVINQLNHFKELENTECCIYPLIRLNFSNNKEYFFEKRILELCLDEYKDLLLKQRKDSETITNLLNDKKQYIMGCDGVRPLVLPRIMIMPTTLCNMKCKDCSSLLPYFHKPEHLSMEQIVEDIETFLNGIDECIRITIGGEPFLYPYIEALLNYLLSKEKFLGIMMFTNSTILPNQNVLNLLKHDKVFVQISDYGHLEKMGRLISVFEENGVRFNVLTDQVWTDMGDTHFRGRDNKELSVTYLNCDQGKLVKSIHNGKFHTCGRSARMLSLGSYVSQNDYFELHKDDDPSLIRNKLEDTYYSSYADACNYCDCGCLPNKHIPSGLQLGKSFIKSEYTIIKRSELEEFKRQNSFSKQ